jgi:predicted MPP superfamily phosphohydrolase
MDDEEQTPDPAADDAPGVSRRERLTARLRALERFRPRDRRIRRALLVALILTVSVFGGLLGIILLGTTAASIGPVEARMSVRPALDGNTVVSVPPLGSLSLDSHDGPFALDVQVTRLNVQDTEQLIRDPNLLVGVEQRVVEDVRSAVVATAVRTGLVAFGGAAVLAFLVFRRRRVRRILICGATALGIVVAGGGLAAATWNPKSVSEPTFDGLLASAPALVGDASDIVNNFDVYRKELAKIVTNVTTLYAAGTALSTYNPSPGTIRILHVSDIHLNPAAWNVIRSVSDQFQVDAIVDTGDLTDHGSSIEARFATNIATLAKPYVFVRGNHDSIAIQRAVAGQPNAIVLDRGEQAEVAGLLFAGWGDPRFTPDKETRDKPPPDVLETTGELFAASIRAKEPKVPNVALVHDPAMAVPLDGLVPLVLAGHGHHRETYLLPKGTRVFEEGSTGAAGLRGLEHEKPTPMECSVLYFDRATGTLQAWDAITLGGLGLSSATIDRQLPDEEEKSPITPPPVTPSTTARPR